MVPVKLNVIPDVEVSNVKIYVDGVQVYEALGQGEVPIFSNLASTHKIILLVIWS